jgi:hypothetical protein
VSEVAAILDGSALLAYTQALLSVGELIAEISDEGQRVGIPAVCLAQARAAVPDDLSAAHLRLLTTASTVVVLPLTTDETGRPDPVWRVGEFARAAGGDLGIGHAVRAALEHEAYYATMEPKRAASILPGGWGILDLSS